MNNEHLYVLNKIDNVAIALEDIQAGKRYQIKGKYLEIIDNIPFGFKVSLEDIKKGANIIKDGFPIGVAVEDIPSGSLVHVHNLKSNRSKEWVMTK